MLTEGRQTSAAAGRNAFLAPDSATAPTTASVSISSTAVLPGTYLDTIHVDGPGALNGPQKAWVNFTVTSLKGDLNRDGIRSPSDIVELLICVLTDPSGANCEFLVADLNCSGDLTPADVVALMYAVFLNQPVPC